MGWRAYALAGIVVVLVAASALIYRAYHPENSSTVSLETKPELTSSSTDAPSFNSEDSSESFVPSTRPVVPYDNKELDRDRLSPEELQAQIELAQETLQRVEQRNKERQRQVQQVFAQAGEAHDSLVHAEVAYQVRAWLDARRDGDITAYFSHYSDEFTPSSDLDLEGWRQQKVAEIRDYQGKDVILEDIQIDIDDSNKRVLVRFLQSVPPQTKLQSRLILENESERWLIVSER